MNRKGSFEQYIIVVLALVAFLVNGCSEKKEPPKQPGTVPMPSEQASPYGDTILFLGRIPFTNASEMVAKHEKFLQYLARELGVKEVRLVLANDYQSILERLLKDEIHIGWLGTISATDIINNPQVKLLAKPVRFGTTSYRGIIITREDNDIQTLLDLKGKKFAWVEKDSASGYIFPKALLLEAGISPQSDFSEAAFLGKHDAVVLNVLLGKYDAGCCYDDARNTLKDKEKVHQLKILATTQDISNEPIVCRENLPEDLKTNLRKAFLKINNDDPAGKEILRDLTDVEGFLPANESDYTYVTKMMKLLENN